MAKPFKETPILTGKDALIFSERFKKNESFRVSKVVRDDIKESFNRIKAIRNFQ